MFYGVDNVQNLALSKNSINVMWIMGYTHISKNYWKLKLKINCLLWLATDLLLGYK